MIAIYGTVSAFRPVAVAFRRAYASHDDDAVAQESGAGVTSGAGQR